jgi:uncharacterized small protein (DUF1192 family)
VSIDVQNLRARIANRRHEYGRPGGSEAVVPTPSPVQPLVRPRQTAGGLHRLYLIPVFGYVLRIITAVFNLPHILANLESFYRSQESFQRNHNLLAGRIESELKALETAELRTTITMLAAEVQALQAQMDAHSEHRS